MTYSRIRIGIAALAAVAALAITGATGVAAAAPLAGDHSVRPAAGLDPVVTGTIVNAQDDGEDDDKLDEDDCEGLENLYNGAVKVASDERARGSWAGWNLMQDIAQETYLDAQFGGCEWAAE